MLRALLIGNTDGIGLATTKNLLADGWEVWGVSRSSSTLLESSYHHLVLDVTDSAYAERIKELAGQVSFDLCIYFAGIGEIIDLKTMKDEVKVFEVNLMGMVKTASAILPTMVSRDNGHFIGISSLADEVVSKDAPSYSASKKGFSTYLKGLSKALKGSGVKATNIRFGFVDTKMAKSPQKPFLLSLDKAIKHIRHCMVYKPDTYSAPLGMIIIIKIIKLFS